jgi:tetratricopeptide (TPR) repeat protein
MSWLVNHTQSEEYASQAEILYRQQEFDRAVALYRLAANAEEEALNSLDCHKTRTIGITVVSAASLYYKAQEFALAKRIAYKWLATDFLPPFAIEELEELLQVIHYDESRQKSGIQSIAAIKLIKFKLLLISTTVLILLLEEADVIEANNYNVFDQRAFVPTPKKMLYLPIAWL